jgi:hypothetical protein
LTDSLQVGIEIPVDGYDAEPWNGIYWTDRDSAGEMELSNRQGKKFQTFQAADAHYGRLPVMPVTA